jgi:hypothetical protein
MLYVPVVGKTGKPLMPCHPARARELVRKGKAVRRFNRGIFYIRLTQREDGIVQSVACGIDPGSKKEAFTIKSSKRTFLNVQADAVAWVKDAIEIRRNMRRARRFRNTPCRKNRENRSIGGIVPSTKARWQWKLRVCKWLKNLYPIDCFIVEDIKAHCFGGKRWNRSFSPLQVGKKWFYEELEKLALLKTFNGFGTKEMREKLGLTKIKDKLSERFEAHCVDSWVLANSETHGHMYPDNTRILCITPLRFHRRQLHKLQFEKGGIRKPYGGTLSHGLKRGSLIKHTKHGLTYVGGCLKDKISLHSLGSGKRLTQTAKVSDCIFLTFNSWRTRLLPALTGGVSAA